jgi:hypothetical protein
LEEDEETHGEEEGESDWAGWPGDAWEAWGDWWSDASAPSWTYSRTAWESDDWSQEPRDVARPAVINLGAAAWTYPVARLYTGSNNFECFLTWPAFEIPPPHLEHFHPAKGSGRFPWDVASEKCRPHATRVLGLYQCTTIAGQKNEEDWQQMVQDGFRLGSYSDSAAGAQRTLLSWMSCRPAMLRSFVHMTSFRSLDQVCPDAGCSEEELHGFWVYFQCHGRPCIVAGDTPWKEFRYGAHGTSMYCIRRIVELRTLSTGMAKLEVNKQEVKGVFYHLTRKAGLCQATYMHYVSLERQGWFYAPLVIIAAKERSTGPDGNARRTVVRRSGADNDQNLTYEGEHFICGVAFHVVHALEIMQAPKNAWYNCDSGWLPSLELNPEYSWEAILEEGSKRRHEAPCR